LVFCPNRRLAVVLTRTVCCCLQEHSGDSKKLRGSNGANKDAEANGEDDENGAEEEDVEEEEALGEEEEGEEDVDEEGEGEEGEHRRHEHSLCKLYIHNVELVGSVAQLRRASVRSRM
jgi:hypothetical protein